MTQKRLAAAALIGVAAVALLLVSCDGESTGQELPAPARPAAKPQTPAKPATRPAVVFDDDFEFIRIEAEQWQKDGGHLVTIENNTKTLMRIVADEEASGGKCIQIPDKAGSRKDNVFARAAYKFTVKKPGFYTFWCRRKWHDACGDTLAVRFDRPGEPRQDSTEHLFGGSDSKPVRWAWSPVYRKDLPGKVRQFFLDKGEHVMEILNLEDGPRYDVVLLTNDRDYVPTGLEDE